MANSDDDSRRPQKGGLKAAAVWVMVGFLIVGLAGFSITSFGGGTRA
jgi:preprotein translocase subunit Sss1